MHVLLFALRRLLLFGRLVFVASVIVYSRSAFPGTLHSTQRRTVHLARTTRHLVTGIILAAANRADRVGQNSLAIFDRRSLSVSRSVALPDGYAKNVNRDPEGHIWVGLAGSDASAEGTVLIFSPTGTLLKALSVPSNPDAGISFAAGRAFIACSANGLSGEIVVVDRKMFNVETTLRIASRDTRVLLLIASAANDDALILAGMTTGPDADAAYSVLTAVDPQTLRTRFQIQLGRNTDIWRIIPNGETFVLLNVASNKDPPSESKDIFLLKTNEQSLITLPLAAHSPLWGIISQNFLYAYHDGSWNSTTTEPDRSLSRLDLKTGRSSVWPLPNNWNASDIAVRNGNIYLTHRDHYTGGTGDGLYKFDPASHQPALVVPLPNASRVIFSDGND